MASFKSQDKGKANVLQENMSKANVLQEKMSKGNVLNANSTTIYKQQQDRRAAAPSVPSAGIKAGKGDIHRNTDKVKVQTENELRTDVPFIVATKDQIKNDSRSAAHGLLGVGRQSPSPHENRDVHPSGGSGPVSSDSESAFGYVAATPVSRPQKPAVHPPHWPVVALSQGADLPEPCSELVRVTVTVVQYTRGASTVKAHSRTVLKKRETLKREQQEKELNEKEKKLNEKKEKRNKARLLRSRKRMREPVVARPPLRCCRSAGIDRATLWSSGRRHNLRDPRFGFTYRRLGTDLDRYLAYLPNLSAGSEHDASM